MRFIYITTIFVFLVNSLWAKNKDSLKNYSYGMNYLYGNVLFHTPKINIQNKVIAHAVEFQYNKQTLGNKIWQQRFGFPETGLSILYAQYSDKRLGSAVGIYPSIQFRLLNFKNSFLYFRMGGGIGIATKHWHRVPYSDTMNNIIGSTLNNVTTFMIGYRVKIASEWSAQVGAHFYHVSNAAARKPNFGINTLGGYVGVQYHPRGFVNAFEKKEDEHRENPFHLAIQTGIGFSEDKAPDGQMYPTYNLNIYAGKMYRGKSRMSVGAEIFYIRKLYALFKNTYQKGGHEKWNALQYALHLQHEFVWGKIGFPMQLGMYLNKPNGGNTLYQKVGINYHPYHNNNKFLNDIYIYTQLKTHYATADYAEVGIGFMF